MDDLLLWSPGRKEEDKRSLTLVWPAGEFVLPFLLLAISLVALINHLQMHLTISWHLKLTIDFISLVTLKMGNLTKKKKASVIFVGLLRI